MINILIIAVFLVLVTYVFQVSRWRKAWVNEQEWTSRAKADIGLTVIIPFKDEEQHVKQLLNSLKLQSYTNWELLLVNDQSKDMGVEIAMQYLGDFPVPIKVLNSPGQGKKMALLHGVEQASTDCIITSDADCYFHPDWLKTMAGYQSETNADLVIGPVGIAVHTGWLERFQSIDFAGLQLSGAAAAFRGQSIMCNGANLLCKRALYRQAKVQPHIASGDDMFLLEWMKQKGHSVNFLKAKEAIVQTKPMACISQFLMQRARWASKAPAYRDWHIWFSALLVSGLVFLMFSTFVAGFWQWQMFMICGSILIIKSISDYTLLKSGQAFYTYPLRFTIVVVIQAVYPLYVLSVLLFPLFKKLTWKGRHI